MQIRRLALMIPVAAALVAAPVAAHEFWIQPERGHVLPGEVIRGDLMVGLRLAGTPYPYLANRFTRFTLTVDGEDWSIAGLDGDLPAFAFRAEHPGLNVIGHQTIAFRASHDDWALFRRYLAEEGLEEFEARHRARGVPETGFAERYTRYAKALVAVGEFPAEARDRGLGLALELTALGDVFDPSAETVEVVLEWQGRPLGGRQVTLYHAAEGAAEVTRLTARTGADGRARLALPGPGSYLLNAVHLEPADAPPVRWASHWASLAFVRDAGG